MIADIIQPNWHVILVHYPLALLTLGVLLEIFGGSRGTARLGGRWMILFGTLLGVPAALSGVFAFREVAAGGSAVDLERHWHEIAAASTWSEAQWEFLSRHVWLTSVGIGLALVIVCTWLAVSERARASLRLPGLIGLLVSVGLVTAGAWHSAESVYGMGTAVAAEPGWPEPSLDLDVLQLHVVAAGAVVALLALALARTLHWPRATIRTGDAVAVPTRAPVLRPWWALGALLGLGAAAGGFWMHAGAFDAEAVDQWWSALQRSDRLLAHAAGGGALLLLALGGLLMPRFIARRSVLATVFGVVLVAAMGVQTWFGTLLLYDSDEGPLTRFVAPPRAEQEEQRTGGAEPAGAVEAAARRHDGAGAAPGEGEEPAEPEASEPEAATEPALVVEMTEARTFVPAQATVPQGSIVEWRNVAERVHTVTAVKEEALDPGHVRLPEGAEPFDSGDIEPGRSWRHRFTVPGRYEYFCVSHEQRGMLGTLIVEPAEQSGSGR